MKATGKPAARRRAKLPAPALPGCPVDSLRIGPYDYRLVFEDAAWEEREEAHGLHDPDRHEITISLARNSQRMADVIVHEINHAVWYVGHMDDARDEECFCARHATGFTMIARDNLAFFHWWLSLLEPTR